MPSIAGSCLCGSVRYASAAQPVFVALCQCQHCQKQSGSAYSVNVAIPKGSLAFPAGKPAVYHDTGSSGLPVHRYFCSACGSPIYSDVVATPQLDWLKAGTLDDTSWVEPTLGIWCESAQNWVSLPEGVSRFPQNPPAA